MPVIGLFEHFFSLPNNNLTRDYADECPGGVRQGRGDENWCPILVSKTSRKSTINAPARDKRWWWCTERFLWRGHKFKDKPFRASTLLRKLKFSRSFWSKNKFKKGKDYFTSSSVRSVAERVLPSWQETINPHRALVLSCPVQFSRPSPTLLRITSNTMNFILQIRPVNPQKGTWAEIEGEWHGRTDF